MSIPVCTEKEVARELSGGGGSVKVLLDNLEETLRIKPEEVKRVKFTLHEKLLRILWYNVKLVFKEGIHTYNRVFVP